MASNNIWQVEVKATQVDGVIKYVGYFPFKKENSNSDKPNVWTTAIKTPKKWARDTRVEAHDIVFAELEKRYNQYHPTGTILRNRHDELVNDIEADLFASSDTTSEQDAPTKQDSEKTVEPVQPPTAAPEEAESDSTQGNATQQETTAQQPQGITTEHEPVPNAATSQQSDTKTAPTGKASTQAEPQPAKEKNSRTIRNDMSVSLSVDAPKPKKKKPKKKSRTIIDDISETPLPLKTSDGERNYRNLRNWVDGYAKSLDDTETRLLDYLLYLHKQNKGKEFSVGLETLAHHLHWDTTETAGTQKAGRALKRLQGKKIIAKRNERKRNKDKGRNFGTKLFIKVLLQNYQK